MQITNNYLSSTSVRANSRVRAEAGCLTGFLWRTGLGADSRAKCCMASLPRRIESILKKRRVEKKQETE